jgi:eukaryotic-like serine/threonine-protein kinase
MAMPDLSGCPWRDELHQMVLGKVRGTRAEAIAQHLDTCPTCLDALRQWIVSDAILEAVQVGRRVEPTKTMYLPIGRIRDAVSTWLLAHDDTRTYQDALPHSLADFKTVLSPPQSADEIGRLADFRVLRLLGVGGMAAVFEAEDLRLKRRVALKVLHPAIAAKPGSNERFLREAQSAAALRHEHIVTIHQVGLHQETPFLVLELLHGETLEDHLARSGRLSVPEIIRIGRELAEGLEAAHARGLLHRDIKPANIWLEGSESSNPLTSASRANGAVAVAGRVKILDFGLAKLWSAEPEISHAGIMIGTPQYMAPEQVAGDAVDPRTDLFSLGCVLYRMATGRGPFGGSDLLSVLRALACEEPTPVRTLNPYVPAAVSDLIGQLISKSPDQRPASAQEVVHRLRAIVDDLSAGSGIGAPATGGEEKQLPGNRGRAVTGLVSGAIGLMILLPLGYLFGAQLIQIATNKGQVVIEIDDPQVEVTIRENRVAILDRPGQREITLAAGEHQLDVTVKEPTGEKTFTTDRFTLSRGGRKIIDVRAELSKALASRPATPPNLPVGEAAARTAQVRAVGETDHDRRAAQSVVSLGGSVIVQLRRQAKSIEVKSGAALPAAGFDVTEINLNARPITDTALGDLTGLKHLETLVLTGTPITDAGLENLQSLVSLRHLLLDGTRITGSGLSNVHGLKNLQNLLLNWSPVADSGLAHLEGLTELRALHLRGTQVTDAGLKHLRTLMKLETLNLSSLPVTDTGLTNLRTLTNLRHLALDRTAVSDAGLVNLEPLTKFESLDLGETQVTDAGLVHLQGLNGLGGIRLKGAHHVGDFAIPKLLHLHRLRMIDLSDTHVSAKGLAILKASLPNSAQIIWSEPNDVAARAVLAAGGRVDIRVQGATADHTAHAPSDLPSDSFQITRVTMVGVRRPLREILEALNNPGVDALGSLDLSDTAIGDADLASLKGLTHLGRLVLDGTKIEGQGLIQLQQLGELVELRLGCPTLSELFLAELAGLKKLEIVSLAKSHVSDVGVRQLAHLAHLKELDLTETNVTAAGVRELQKSIPACRILTTPAPR